MISIQKFLKLPSEKRLRKLWRFTCEFEIELRSALFAPAKTELSAMALFLRELTENANWPELFSDPQLSQHVSQLILESTQVSAVNQTTLWAVSDLRHKLGALIGNEAAEWDLLPPIIQPIVVPPSNNPKPLRLVYCDSIRSPFNVGSIFRTAEAFGFSGIILSPDCPAVDHVRLQRSAMGATNWLPHQVMTFDQVLSRYQVPIFAIELGGTNVADFDFPIASVAVLGSEELGVRPEILEYCHKNTGVVSIALHGAKASLNVGVSFGIVAAAWAS